MDFSIEHLTSDEDIEFCARLMIRASPWNRLYFSLDQCLADLSSVDLEVYGAVGGGHRILGFIAAMEKGVGFEPLLEYACVGEALRSTGIGSRLIRYFEDDLFPDADNLYLFVSDINPRAMRLYSRLGYLMVGALPDYNLETQTEFLFRKSRRPRQAARMAKATDPAAETSR